MSLSNDEESLSAMILETEEFPALVAFSEFRSCGAVRRFYFRPDRRVKKSICLKSPVRICLAPLSSEFGLLINPESDDAVMIEPKLLQLDEVDE